MRLRSLLMAAFGWMLSTLPGVTAAAAPASPASAYHLEVQPPGAPPLRLYAEETGHGPPMLLLHGLGGSGYSWRLVAPLLAQSHRVILLDLKGHGRSDKPFDARYSTADQAELVLAFIRRRGLKGLTIAGHSYGGFVALLAAIEAERTLPGRIARVVTVSAPLMPQTLSVAIRLLQTPVLPYVALTLVPADATAAASLFTEAIGMGHITSADVAIYAEPLREAGGRHALIQAARQIAPSDPGRILNLYRRLRTPVLVMGCRADRVVPIQTAITASSILPRARLSVLEGCDHIPLEQSPAILSAHILRFAAR
jgi:pimeloyl-ACP methyl ester carboxylesterase